MRIRHRLPILAVIFSIAAGALAGCMNDAPLEPASPPAVRFSEAIAPVELVFLERDYDSEADATTFLYQLQPAPGFSEATLDGILGVFTDVAVEIPACAPELESWFPTDGALVDTTVVGFYGITWGVGYDENPDFHYSITFPGDVEAGTVRSLITTGGFTYLANITGPCAGGNSVGGTVYIDTNGDGMKGETEFGIADVTVVLTEDAGEGTTQQVKTDSEGHYAFVADNGDYTVSIPEVTAATDFNETLYENWNNTSPVVVDATVSGADVTGIDFGWEPDIDAIIANLEAGDLTSEGKSYKWWRKEFLRVLEGNEETAYTEAELLDFVHQVEELALLDEFDFTEGNELREVFNILNNHAFDDGDGESITKKYNGRQDPHADLLRELLTSELNFVSGRGIVDQALLHEILIMWGEGVADATSQAPAFTIELPGDQPNLIETPEESGTKLFSRLNGATGGGGTN